MLFSDKTSLFFCDGLSLPAESLPGYAVSRLFWGVHCPAERMGRLGSRQEVIPFRLAMCSALSSLPPEQKR